MHWTQTSLCNYYKSQKQNHYLWRFYLKERIYLDILAKAGTCTCCYKINDDGSFSDASANKVFLRVGNDWGYNHSWAMENSRNKAILKKILWSSYKML